MYRGLKEVGDKDEGLEELDESLQSLKKVGDQGAELVELGENSASRASETEKRDLWNLA